MSDEATYKSHEETVAETLSRYSVFDLREMSDEDLERGDEMFSLHGHDIEVVESGETNLIRWWQIASGGHSYGVRRFENFVYCSCKDFFFNRTVCKHISITVGPPKPEKPELKVGDLFWIACRSYKKTSVFRVESVDDKWVRCIDIKEAEGSVPRCNYDFRPFQIDLLTEQGKLRVLPPNYGQTRAFAKQQAG